MVTRRRLLESGIGGGTALALAACGSSSTGTADVAPPAQIKAGSTLIYWNDMAGAYPGIMTEWATRFEGKTKVKVEATGGVADYGNKLVGAFASGSGPDIFRYLQENIPMPAAVERNMLMKLDPYVKRDKYDLNDFRKDSIALYQWKGSLYALPRDYGLQLIFYNTELFQREGLQPIPTDWNDKTWTFQKFQEYAVRLTKPDRYATFVPRGNRLWGSFVYTNGGAIVKKNDGTATEMALAEKPAVDALQFMQDLIYKHKVAPLPTEEAGLGTPQALLQNGRLAMWITNPGGNQNFKTVQGLPYEVGVFPLGAGAKRAVGGGGTGWGANATTKLPEEAWAFVSYIASKEAELDEVRIGQTTPARISVGTSPEYLAAPPKNAKVFSDGQEFVTRDPIHSKWPDVSRDVLTAIFNDQLWSGKATAAQLTKEVKEKGDPYFKS